MKKVTFTACLFAMVLAPKLLADTAQSNSNRMPNEVVFSQTANMEGTVQDIDYKNRIVTLKGPQGNVVRIEVGQNAPNFSQLRKGDKVMAQYYQSTALALQKPGEAATTGVQEQVRTKPAQGNYGPSRMMVSRRQVTAMVTEVDRQNRTVTLKGPEGNTVQLKADPSVQGFDQLKTGDQIVATYTDALGISVQRESQ